MSELIDMTGQVRGCLTVIERAGSNRFGALWLCQCVCGERAILSGATLRRRRQRCGKCRFKRRGEIHQPTYNSWRAMVDRCTQPNHTCWPKYGGRGTMVCDRWRFDYGKFIEDMGERPKGTTIDRIDVHGHYEPGNCRWATAIEQRANRTRDPQRSKTHCPRGHEYTFENTRMYNGKRHCRTCARERSRHHDTDQPKT